MRGLSYLFFLRQLLRDILPSIMSELRKLFYFALRAVPLLLLLLVPLVNVVVSVLWVLFSAWMMTVQYMDYPMANHQLFFKEQRARLRKRPLLAWSFGGLVMLCTLVPVLNRVMRGRGGPAMRHQTPLPDVVLW